MFLNGFLLIKVTVLIAVSKEIYSFNFEEKYHLIATGKPGSYFGYSLAVQENGAKKWLFVGAPKDSHLGNAGLSGALYKCGKSGMNLNCNSVTVFQPGESATDQWLGASVASRNGTTMVCSPRNGEKVDGKCYYSRENLPFESYVPWNENFCELGFSAALSSDGNRFYTGAPSCKSNAGRLIASTGPNIIDRDMLTGNVSYYSYAMSTGKIFGQTEGLVLSVGFHQNSSFAGQIVLLNSIEKLELKESLEGHQPGEHFGASLAVFDINNDGRDDIIVGAPHHSIYTNSEIKFDVGAVYVYYQTSKGIYQKENSLNITGKISGGQFGFAVANLGDSNGDGYNDLAVGAPYENDGSGVVYIYHGWNTNLRNRLGQILKGSSYTPPIRSFGFSFISGGSDFDGNGYGDLTVGAYESDIVVHIPARPVVRMANKLNFDPSSITLEKKECSAKIGGSNVQVTCSKLRYCLTYDGRAVPGSINTNITVILDVKQPKAHRLLFIKTNEHTMTQIVGLSVKTELCQEEYVYVRPDIRDKLTSIDAQIVPTLVVTDAPLSPILDIYDGNGRVIRSLPIFKDCGSDDICIPDLQMTVTTSAGTYIQGSRDRWTVDVTIYNAAEDAFGAEFYLDLPPVLSYINTDKDFTDSSVLCFPPDEKNGPYLRCEIGNPLPSKKTARLRVIVEPKPGDDNFVSFLAQTNSTIGELASTMADNKKWLNLKFEAEAKLVLSSFYRPETLTVNVTTLQLNETAAMPEYTQFYEVRNEGPSDIIGAKFRIVFPTHTAEGYAINELKAQPTIQTGAVTCETVPLMEKPNKEPIYINCVVDRIIGGQRVVVKLMAQFASEAFLKQLNTETFALTSVITANITGLPFDQDVSHIPTATAEVIVNVKKIAKELNLLKATPWWIPVVSAIVATAIVAGIAGVLHHYGFFKRNRPFEMTATLETVPESQPLQPMRQNSNRPTSEVDRTVYEDS